MGPKQKFIPMALLFHVDSQHPLLDSHRMCAQLSFMCFQHLVWPLTGVWCMQMNEWPRILLLGFLLYMTSVQALPHLSLDWYLMRPSTTKVWKPQNIVNNPPGDLWRQ